MKKLLLTLLCVAASAVPQCVWAQATPSATVNGSTLTIVTTADGQLASGGTLASAITDLTDKNAITEIVLEGEFNTADLTAINSTAGFTAVTKVDMSEAHFYGTAENILATYSTWDATSQADANSRAVLGSGVKIGTDPNFTYYKATADNSAWTAIDASEASSIYGTTHADIFFYYSKSQMESYKQNNGAKAIVGRAYKYNSTSWEAYPGFPYWGKSASDVYVYASDSDLGTSGITTDGALAIVADDPDTQDAEGLYQFNKSFTWTPVTAADSRETYAVMDFKGWKETLTEAITSKYDEYETQTREMFEGCKAITKVTYNSGNAIFTPNDPANYALREIVIGKGVTRISGQSFKQKTNLTTLTFEGVCDHNTTDDKDLVIESAAFEGCTNLEMGKLPNRLKEIQTQAFQDAFSVANNVKFEVCEEYGISRLETINSGAFTNSKLTEVLVPRSVTEIQSGAFFSCINIAKITFQEYEANASNQPALIIRHDAFAGGGAENDYALRDVYVNIDPEKRKLVCEYDAFAKISGVGQTDVLNDGLIAKLHFDKNYWSYYGGNWKLGLAFAQSNLNKIWGGYENEDLKYGGLGDVSTALESTGFYTCSDDTKEASPANGWQQFAMTSTGIDIVIPSNNFIRTYSTKVPQAIPTYAYDLKNGEEFVHHAGDPMFKIYRISSFADGYVSGASTTAPASGVNPKATATLIEARMHAAGQGEGDTPTGRLYIPVNTGVIMASGEDDEAALVYMSTINIQNPVSYPFAESGDNANLLYPTCKGTAGYVQEEGDDDYKQGAPRVVVDNTEEKVKVNPTIPYPYNKTTHQLQYRVFGLSTNTNYNGKFSRMAAGALMSRDKAYLKLNTNLFHYSAEGEGISGSGVDPQTGNPVTVGAGAPIMLSFVDADGEVTAVRKIDAATMTVVEDCYYTLQGVRLNVRPTQQGVYIHNGKKIVVK